MKRLATLPSTLTLFGTLALFTMMLLPTTEAMAELGTWAYPFEAKEKTKRIKELSVQLDELDHIREEQLTSRSKSEETLITLLSQLQAAEEALKIQQAPLHFAMEKYRQAQQIALTDPMIDVDIQRLEFIQVQAETAQTIQVHQDEVDQLNLLVARATEDFSNARANMDATLRQIDNLWLHRSTIERIVFVRSVDD